MVRIVTEHERQSEIQSEMMSSFGHYKGDLVTKWLHNAAIDAGVDRSMELMADFAFVDGAGKHWRAKKGRIVNGANIPSALWSSLGSPLAGNYRRAVVLHDIACQDQIEPPEDVHRMFFHAMRCDGVGLLKAAYIYEAVRFFGPTWGPEVAGMMAAMPGGVQAAMVNGPCLVDLDRVEIATERAVYELGDVAITAIDARVQQLLIDLSH